MWEIATAAVRISKFWGIHLSAHSVILLFYGKLFIFHCSFSAKSIYTALWRKRTCAMSFDHSVSFRSILPSSSSHFFSRPSVSVSSLYVCVIDWLSDDGVKHLTHFIIINKFIKSWCTQTIILCGFRWNIRTIITHDEVETFSYSNSHFYLKYIDRKKSVYLLQFVWFFFLSPFLAQAKFLFTHTL